VVHNAKVLAQQLMAEGIDLVSQGTDNHMVLADLTHFNITGKDAQDALGRAGITVNKNAIPFETRSPMITSGIRLGTPALTTRGMKSNEMIFIAKLIVDVLKNPGNEQLIDKTRKKVRDLCKVFPLYADIG
jgi:glycine hydroxymethyltransferase